MSGAGLGLQRPLERQVAFDHGTNLNVRALNTEDNLMDGGRQIGALPPSQTIAQKDQAALDLAASQQIQQQQTPTQDNAQLQRSYYFSSNDRFDQEQYYQQPLTAPSMNIIIEKVQVLRLDQNKTLTNTVMMQKLRIDGVYCDKDPQMHQKCNDQNILRLEQRLLREKPFVDQMEATLMLNSKTKYFKMNGDLKLHNDLLADEITRPADLAFEQSEAYQTKEINAILSDRMHSYKKRYYRLDIVVGKIALQSYPQFFCLEDRLALELKEQYKEWERRTSLALIPFYMERLKFMEDEQYKRHRDGGNPLTSHSDDEFLLRNIEETQRKLDQEKREVQEHADILYRKWQEIKEVRKKNQYSATNLKMKVNKGSGGEIYFNLVYEEPSFKLQNGTALPNSEVARRNNAISIRAYVRLIINGKYVTRSHKALMKWPNLEIEIAEQFQVCLFTMPSSIQLELVVGGIFKEQLVDVLNIEVPGSHVKALTSAATLVKELPFSKRYFDEKKVTAKKLSAAQVKAQTTMTEEQKIQEKKKQEVEEKKAQDNDVRGVIYVKAEWKGEGPEMPPMRSENVFRQQQPQKNRKSYTEDEQSRMLLRQLYIDVNDPRNERIIKVLKETKNEFLIRLLKDDAKNPCSNLQPFRHMLLEARAKDPDLAKEQIPLLEQEVINSPNLLDKLEVLFREKAYKEYLERKIEEERVGVKNKDDKKVYNLDLEDNAIKFDSECIRRRQMFFDKLKHFQREMQSGGHQKASTQYKSIIREFELLESENPLLAMFNKLFITGRKLRPVVQKRQAVSLEACKDAKILVHIIKGFNVPIRNSAKQDILANFQRGGNQRMPFNAGSMNPYGNRTQGPFPTTLNQLQGTAFGNMNATGGGQQFDQRQSFAGGSAIGNGGFQQSYVNDRMMGVNLNNNQNMMGNRPQHTQIGDIRQLSEDQLRQLYKTQRVEPLVEVRIVYNEDYSEVKLTNIAEGDFPEWNEILEFPLKALNKKRFTKQELINTKTMIYITLFDRELSMFNTGRVEIEQNYRYLGSFSIPLIALLNNPPKIDAIFKVNRPLALFNYQVESNTFFFLNQETGSQLPGTNAKKEQVEVPNTYISMSISLDPVLELPQDNLLEYYIGLEKQNLLAAASEWIKVLKKGKREKRNIKVYGENVSGQSVLLCRYILPQTPPPDVYDYNSPNSANDKFAIEKAARFVSLIPMVEDNQAFISQMPDLWCTSQEFLDLGAGDVEEHAVILCNYFNFIDQHQKRTNIESYLVLGLGYPEGRTAYVMRRDKLSNHVELWNPMRGEAYYYGRDETTEKVLGCIAISSGFKMNKRMNDAICQLKAIGCIISRDNVWANIQEYEDPALLDYDLENSKMWKPFFNKSNRSKYFPNEATIHSEQVPVLRYMKPMDKERADVIAMKIQNFITEQFENQRIKDNRMRTKWNNQMETILNSILAQCEMKRKKARQGATNSSLRGDQANQDEDVQAHISAIQAQINTNAKGQKSWGFPINVTFVSLQMLWEEVKNTKIHLVYDDDAEFSLYVYVEPYSHNVLSVWFYLLALTKDKHRAAGGQGNLPY